MARAKKKTPRRLRGREDPLATKVAAIGYISEQRGYGGFSVLHHGAGLGVALAAVMRKVFDLEKWMASRRNQAWLKSAGGAWLGYSAAYFHLQSSQRDGPVIPLSGLAKDLFDLISQAQAIHVASASVLDRLRAESGTRALVVTCSNALTMMAVFSTRAARASKMPKPTATELAALAVLCDVERETVALDEMDRRIDKFRKVLATLPRAEGALAQLCPPAAPGKAP